MCIEHQLFNIKISLIFILIIKFFLRTSYSKLKLNVNNKTK